MKNKAGKLFLFLIVLVGIPYALTMRLSGKMELQMTYHVSREYLIIRTEGGQQEEIPLEEYLMGVIPFYLSLEEPEVDKVMAVLIRTYLYYQMNLQKTTSLSEETLFLSYYSPKERETLWGESFLQQYERFEKAVFDTEGEVLLWKSSEEKESQPIYPYFHEISAGKTRGKLDAPYLKEVICESDKTEDGFLSLSVWKGVELEEALQTLGFSEQEYKEGELLCSYDIEPYVENVSIEGTTVGAEEFKNAFSLPSFAFEIEKYHDGIRILTKGKGSGYGVSLKMANHLAKEGMSYKEILSYFYEGELGKFEIFE